MKPDPHWRTTNVKRRRTKFCGQADLVPVTGAPLLWTKSTDPKTCEQNDTSEEKLKWKQKQYTVRLTLYSPVVTIRTASLTFNNSTFCPHSVFMCFVWIWGQTAIISLYSIDWLVGFYNRDGVCWPHSSFYFLSAHAVYLCVLYGSQNNQRLFPCSALTDWFL